MDTSYRSVGLRRAVVPALILLLALLIVLPAGAGPAPAASLPQGKGEVPQLFGVGTGQSQVPAPPQYPQVVLYDQYNNLANSGSVSQNFESAYDAYDNQGADDFIVPAGQTWNIQSVDVAGIYFNGLGPAASVNVWFYSDSGTLPGTQVYQALNVVPVDTGGSFVINLPSAAVLSAGTYWVSVQANLDFSIGGEWAWTDRTALSNNGAAWRNPGNGFGSGCINWTRKTTCIPAAGGPDNVFRLNGTVGGAGTSTPTATACVGANVFSNPGFESGDFSGWTVQDVQPAPAVVTGNAHSGTYSAHVGSLPGGETPGDSSFYQTITVPAAGGTLSFWYWPRTIDSISFDWQDAYVTNTSGGVLATIFHQASNTQTWTNQTFDMAPYAGQTVRIKFLVHGDSAGDPTDMYVDDVVLNGECAATPTNTATSTATATVCVPGYSVQTSTGASIVPGVTDSGNHCDDCTTAIALPFAVTLYGNSYNSVNASSNGNLQFVSTNGSFSNVCLPTNTLNYAILPYWDDLYTLDIASGQGIFTSVSGTAGSRIFNIEWRAAPCCTTGISYNFEVRLHEDTASFEVIYGSIAGTGSSATIGVQKDTGSAYTQFSCNSASVSQGMQLSYIASSCAGTPTATNTPTPTPTETCTAGGGYDVLIVYADTGAPTSLPAALAAEPGITSVTLFNGGTGTPTLAQLQQYDIVVPFSNSGWSDQVTLGNNLAAYQDSGGIVVAFNFDWYGSLQSIQGNWQTGGYSPFVSPGGVAFSNGTLGSYNAGHPLMQGVTTLNAYFRENLTLTSGATTVASWNDGLPLIVYKGRAVGINMYPGDFPANYSGQFSLVIANAGRWLSPQSCGATATNTATNTPGGTPTDTPTPTATTCTGGTPTWTTRNPFSVDVYGSFAASNGTYAYMGGGYSFSAAGNITNFGRFDPAANSWTSLAAVPDLNNALAAAEYVPGQNKIYVFGGEQLASSTVVATTRIYDIATNTWTTGANMPDIRAFMAHGYYNGKIYLVGGYSTGNVSPAYLQVWEYDPAANTFTTKTPIPAAAGFGGAGSAVINGHLYVAGGRDSNVALLNTLWDYNIAGDSWTARATLPSAINVPAAAVLNGQLWVIGGGTPFDNNPSAFAESPLTTNVTRIYDPASNAWSTGPTLNQQRSFPAGTTVGNTAVVMGGYTGSTTTNSVETASAAVPCGTPTPTATVTNTPAGTSTNTATPTATVSANVCQITNGGFETGDFTGWTIDGFTNMPVVNSDQPHTGTYSALLGTLSGAEPNGDSSFYQQITIPSGGGTLSYWYWPYTTDSISYDWQDAYVTDASGNILATIMHVAENTQTWTNVTYDMTPYAGQTVRVKFLVHEDGFGDDTAMYVDDVTFSGTGTCTPPTVTTTPTITNTPGPSETPPPTATCGAPAAWNSAAPVPVTIARYAFAKVANDLYVIGGVSNGTVVSSVYRYNIVSGTWSTLASVPANPGEAPAAAYYNGKIYLAPGNGVNSFFIYDVNTNTWSAGPTFPGIGYGAAAGAYNGKFYVVGGNITSGTYIYDIAASTWSAGPAAPMAYALGGYTQVGQYLYIVGSYGTSPFKGVLPGSLQGDLQQAAPNANGNMTVRLDMGTESFSTGPTWTMARADFGLASNGTKLFAIGGDADGGTYFDPQSEVDELDLTSWPGGTWVASPPMLPSPREANQAGFYAAGTMWSTGAYLGGGVFLNEHLFRVDASACAVTPTPTVTGLPAGVQVSQVSSGAHGSDDGMWLLSLLVFLGVVAALAYNWRRQTE